MKALMFVLYGAFRSFSAVSAADVRTVALEICDCRLNFCGGRVDDTLVCVSRGTYIVDVTLFTIDS